MTMPFISKPTFRAMVLAALASSCLPTEDGRPTGHLVMTLSGDEALASGLTTVDGWYITFDRFLLSAGQVEMTDAPGDPHEDTCVEYSAESTSYVRVVDMSQPGPQRLATSAAIGRCELAFMLFGPLGDTVLGSGVDGQDLGFMREAASDGFVSNVERVVYVRGSAAKAGATVRFDWSFRQFLGYRRCGVFDLEDGEWQTTDIRIRSRVLFQDRVDEATAELRFDPFAADDADADGVVTLDELRAVPRLDNDSFATLADLLYRGLVPQLPRTADGTDCFGLAINVPEGMPQRR